MSRPRPSADADVLELDGADAYRVALPGTGACQRPLDAHPPEPVLDVRDRLLVREVGHGDDAFRRPARDPPGAVVVPNDREALLDGAEHDEGLAFGLAGPGIGDHRPKRADELVEALAGDGGDA